MFKSLLLTSFSSGMLLISSVAAKDDIKASLMSDDSRLAREAINLCISKGEAMLPQLQKWTRSDSIKLRMRAKDAIGKITGQWGSHTNLIWQTDFDEAQKKVKQLNKPLLVLQLFGNLNEEFC